MRRTRSAEREEGFTLIELLISVSILVIILGAISSAMVAFLKNATYTTARDDHSAGAALLSSYLDRDLASADENPIPTSGLPTMGTGPCARSKTFTLRWTEYTASRTAPTPVPGPVFRSTYTVVADPDDPLRRCQLVRTLTRDGATVESATLVRNLLADPSTGPVAVDAAVAASCPAGTFGLVVTVRGYDDDSASPYFYSGCAKARTR